MNGRTSWTKNCGESRLPASLGMAHDDDVYTFVDTQACMRYMLTHITVRRVPIIMRISPIRPCPKLATSAHNFAPCGSAVFKIIILTTVQGPENKDHDMMAAMGKLVSISLQPRNTHSLCTRFWPLIIWAATWEIIGKREKTTLVIFLGTSRAEWQTIWLVMCNSFTLSRNFIVVLSGMDVMNGW